MGICFNAGYMLYVNVCVRRFRGMSFQQGLKCMTFLTMSTDNVGYIHLHAVSLGYGCFVDAAFQ